MRITIRKVAAMTLMLALLVGTAIRARAQFVDAQAAHESFEAKAVSKRHQAELMKIPHVRSVIAELNAQKETAILVKVDDPKNIEDVTNKLPSQIEGFPVDVDAAFGAQAGAATSDVDLGEGFSVENGFESSATPTRTTDAKPEGAQ